PGARAIGLSAPLLDGLHDLVPVPGLLLQRVEHQVAHLTSLRARRRPAEHVGPVTPAAMAMSAPRSSPHEHLGVPPPPLSVPLSVSLSVTHRSHSLPASPGWRHIASMCRVDISIDSTVTLPDATGQAARAAVPRGPERITPFLSVVTRLSDANVPQDQTPRI